MKKAFKIIGIAVMLAAIAFSMAACDDGSGPGGSGGSGGGGSGGGGRLEGNGVIWEQVNSSGAGIGSGLIFKDGYGYTAILLVGDWYSDSHHPDWTYTSTHMTSTHDYMDEIKRTYTVSGDTLTTGPFKYTKRTGQTIIWDYHI